MTMRTQFAAFIADESGAVTVDWVVLTAAVVGLGVVAVDTVERGVVSLAEDIKTAISTKSVNNGNGGSGDGGGGDGGSG